ncbi:MAG: hypothetical protein LBK03_02805 [Bacteroidales bacterium]|jgi:hypothetical protein|nr:hypothetical protein [Bacteroidales bacterium]
MKKFRLTQILMLLLCGVMELALSCGKDCKKGAPGYPATEKNCNVQALSRSVSVSAPQFGTEPKIHNTINSINTLKIKTL